MDIITVDKSGEKRMTIDGYECCERRVLRLTGSIDSQSVERLIQKLEYLDEQSDEDITIYINSPGGVVSDGFALIDAVSRLKSKVIYIVQGNAFSMAAFILASGEKGCRKATANSEIMIHQILGGASGQASDIELAAKHINRLKYKINFCLARWTGRDITIIQHDTDRDFYLDANEAFEYGIIDEII